MSNESIKSIISRSVPLLEKGKSAEAETLLEPVLQMEPDNFHALQLYGLARHLAGDHADALSHLEKALQINPDFAPVRHNIAGIYRNLGEMHKAEENFRAAIALKPDYVEAYQGLAEIIRFKPGDPLIRQLETQLKGNLKPNQRSYLHFSAGKIHDDLGDYQQAFFHYDQANKLKNFSNLRFDNGYYLQRIRKVYSAEYFASHPHRGHPSPQAIFVVGMPRSGSTLTEQILASHSRIFGVGEVNDISSIATQINRFATADKAYPECMPAAPDEACAGMGGAYLNRVFSLKKPEDSADHCLNKNLFNYMHLGLIRDLLPHARIIHIQRHPLDTCLSCYFQNFSNGVQWSFNLNNISAYYRNYRAMMQHWQQNFPERILTVNYENLVRNAATESRRMIEFCGLAWEENCLRYYQHKATIKTASVWQARQPIYQQSRGRWQNYLPCITGLSEDLADHVAAYENELTLENSI